MKKTVSLLVVALMLLGAVSAFAAPAPRGDKDGVIAAKLDAILEKGTGVRTGPVPEEFIAQVASNHTGYLAGGIPTFTGAERWIAVANYIAKYEGYSAAQIKFINDWFGTGAAVQTHINSQGYSVKEIVEYAKRIVTINLPGLPLWPL